MRRTQDTVVVVLLFMIVVLLILNILATRFESQVAQAGGGVQGDGWIAFSGQKADGPELVYVLNTKRGQQRQTNNKKWSWNDNGPRLAVYQVSSQGKIKLTSMRNVGPDVDEWIDAFYPDASGPSVREVKNQNRDARKAKEENPNAEEDAGGGDGGMPTE